MNDVRFKFWFAGERNWPRDTASHVFLARAVYEIGTSLFGDDWGAAVDIIQEFEPAFTRWPSERTQGAVHRAHDLLAHHRPEFGRTRRRANQRVRGLDPEEWLAADQVVAKLNEEVGPGIRRFQNIKESITQQAQAGKLVIAIRPLPGGEFREAPPWWWNSEAIDSRFQMCQLNPEEPFSSGFAGDGYHWIYVTRASLDGYIRSLAPEAKQTVSVENQCQVWLERQFALPATENWGKDHFQTAAAERFGGALAVRMFLRAWDAAVKKAGNESRRKAGRKPS
jgi:hypothetical protein